jgi:hypothetical protein
MRKDRSAITSADSEMGPATAWDFDRLSTKLPDHTRDAFMVALDEARAYDAGKRPSIGTYSADRVGQIVGALLEAGYLSPPESQSRIEKIRGAAHHHLNPLIGWLRMQIAEPDRPRFSGLEDQAVVDRLYAALDAVDAACGHRPLREELDDMQARIKAQQQQS